MVGNGKMRRRPPFGHIIDESLGSTHTMDNASHLFRHRLAGQNKQGIVAVYRPSAVIDDRHPVSIGIVNKTHIGSYFQNFLFEIHAISFVIRIGQMVWEGAVKLPV